MRKIIEIYLNDLGNGDYSFEVETTENSDIAKSIMILIIEKFKEITEEIERYEE